MRVNVQCSYRSPDVGSKLGDSCPSHLVLEAETRPKGIAEAKARGWVSRKGWMMCPTHTDQEKRPILPSAKVS